MDSIVGWGEILDVVVLLSGGMMELNNQAFHGSSRETARRTTISNIR